MSEKIKHLESKFVEGAGRAVGTAKRGISYAGWTVNEMAIIFNMDRRTLIPRISSVAPCGKRGQIDLYQIRDVAPYLVKPAGNIEEYIRKMRPNDLPPVLQKEYWNGQRAKQAYLENNGDLWRTDRIVEVLSTVFQTLKMSLLLIPDAIERRSTLSDGQQQELRDQIDVALAQMRQALIDQFAGDTGADGTGPGIDTDHGEREPAPAEDDDDDFFRVPVTQDDDDEL